MQDLTGKGIFVLVFPEAGNLYGVTKLKLFSASPRPCIK